METLFRTILVLGGLLAGIPDMPAQTPIACLSTCSGNLGENIFPDGDFGSGQPNVLPFDPGLAPGYTYQLNPPPNDGYYTITNNTTSWGWFAANTWIDIQDNGPEPNGYMMVVNASYQPGLFYRKQVPVCENTLYEFSIDVISMNLPAMAASVIQPQVAFQIDGNTVCETGKVPVDAQWHTYRFSFTTAPGVTQVTLSLRNNAPGGIGNDLAIDNISFRACGPHIDVPVTAFFCPGQPLSLHADLSDSPYNTTFYQWQYQPAGGVGAWQDLPGANAATVQVPHPANGDQYRLIAANSYGNLALPFCRSVSLTVEAMAEDLSGFAITGTDTTRCNGRPARLNAGSFAHYLWSDGATAASREATAQGWYAVTVTSANGCQATDSLYVYDVQLSGQAGSEDPHCAGDSTGSIRVTGWQGGIGAVQFALNGGPPQGTPDFPHLGSGAYVLRVSDAVGCWVDIPVVLTDPPPLELALGADRSIFVCDTIALSATANFPLRRWRWEPVQQVDCAQCPTAVAMPLATTWFSLLAEDERGCRATDSILISVLPRLDVYAPNVFWQSTSDNRINNAFALFPSKSATRVALLEIYDRWGSLVFRRERELPGAADLRWDGTDTKGRTLEQGVYIWRAALEFTDGTTRYYSGDVTLLRQ